ncbi:MAG: NAD(P)H-dependent oxidoreductase subunit E [Methylophilales bacterium]|jgi:NADH-quinone oxidoreductase subunit E|nr:NAD(P)H-dependent oxidoreductase subunit E [Pseudomonadota bacterium]NQW34287.1 NAD(P)H-dependent oxidoreductase subunit E [Methylophilales bacterium]HCK03228.1 NAD(P)H-dependent oxidoreductase subunit E [Methylophilaceae bacterium]|tara:strand:- start:18412 stop:18885 length:474 start_codon:yes stop_codon:yes gene_type:complete
MLSIQSKNKIDQELKKYPDNQKKSAVIAALQIIQKEKGWLSNKDISLVSQYLEIPEIAAMEVATFYNMFDLKNVGKYKISVCTNISCMLRDAEKLVNHMKKKFDIDFNELSKDGKFYLKESECMGACGGAPLITINNHDMYENLTIDKFDEIIEGLK